MCSEDPGSFDASRSEASGPEEAGRALGAGLNLADPNSQLAFLYLRLSQVVAVLGLTTLVVFFTYLPVWHTDLWAHLRFGEEMVRKGRLPEHENFSGDFADQDRPYVNFQWLTQAGAYLLFALGEWLAGPDADTRLAAGALVLSTAHGLVVGLRFLLLLLAFRRLTGFLSWALAGLGLAFIESYFNHLWIIRPQVIGELFFAALLLALSLPTLSRRALWLIPLLFIVWANCHGSFPVGLALLGAVLVGRGLERFWNSEAPKGLPRLGVVLVLSAAATCINPHGPGLLAASLGVGDNPNITTMEEWKPLPVKSPSGVVFLSNVLVLVPLLRLSPRRWTPTQVLLLLGFGLQTMAHTRILVWWAMVFPWVVLPHLQAVCRMYFPDLLTEKGPPNLRWTLVVGLGMPLLLVWSMPLQWVCFGEKPILSRRVSAATPVQAARIIRQAYEAEGQGGPGRCVFASETLGDYLLWDLRGLNPPVRVFCYTHVHLLTPEHWKECLAVKLGQQGWQEILDRHGISFLVVEERLYREQTGFSDLVDQVEATHDRWEVLTRYPVFLARRIGRQ